MRDSGTYALVLGNVRGAQVRDNLIDGVFRRPGVAGSRGLERVFDAKEHEAGAVSRTSAGAAAVLVFASEDVEFSGNTVIEDFTGNTSTFQTPGIAANSAPLTITNAIIDAKIRVDK
jgi:hypothetical protein